MIYFLGDVHGRFDHVQNFIQERRVHQDAPCSLIFLGDIEAPRPFEDMIRPLLDEGAAVWFIHGNHDTNRSQSWDNLQDSQHRNLNGRIEIIEGFRVAGVGGIFRGEVWYPGMKCHENTAQFEASPQKKFTSYTEYADQLRASSLKSEEVLSGKLLKHKSTIFPQTIDSLRRKVADVMVSHEAPDGHPHGFSELGRLASAMGVTHYFHGHHHDSLDYTDWRKATGINLHGVGFRGITNMNGEIIVQGTTLSTMETMHP